MQSTGAAADDASVGMHEGLTKGSMHMAMGLCTCREHTIGVCTYAYTQRERHCICIRSDTRHKSSGVWEGSMYKGRGGNLRVLAAGRKSLQHS